ncbi:hypothetical protein G7067_11705 [Leucobacter insecticola]|uniref:DUF559 domain-containing protein n=1 Tax=Leucobacter insecticola TaxID=2714934 RepID=A0A6G8FKN5_9MICO|nr:hypothetical protein [Leucobacter insecticola]QIM16914.1 hypothetical protein G7067_11705 [Leucobacter insecticola]
MTRTPLPLASKLQDAAFTVATGIQAGLTRQAVRHHRFTRPHHGVRTLQTAVPHNELDRKEAERLARDYAPLLRPGEAFSHTTALLLLRVPIHTHPELHLTVPHHVPHARGKNVQGHRTRLAFRTIPGRSGLPCVPHVLALTQSARMLSFRELVVAIDHLIRIRGRRGSRWSLSTPDALHKYFHDHAVPGVDRLRAALEIARIGADSRMETLMHFELARMGVDILEMQGEIFTDSGQWIGRFDQVDRAAKRISEYDGEQHRTDRKQYLHDDKRLDAARDAGWKVRRFHKEDFQADALEATRAELCEFLELTPKPLPRHLAPYFAEPLHLPRAPRDTRPSVCADRS